MLLKKKIKYNRFINQSGLVIFIRKAIFLLFYLTFFKISYQSIYPSIYLSIYRKFDFVFDSLPYHS